MKSELIVNGAAAFTLIFVGLTDRSTVADAASTNECDDRNGQERSELSDRSYGIKPKRICGFRRACRLLLLRPVVIWKGSRHRLQSAAPRVRHPRRHKRKRCRLRRSVYFPGLDRRTAADCCMKARRSLLEGDFSGNSSDFIGDNWRPVEIFTGIFFTVFERLSSGWSGDPGTRLDLRSGSTFALLIGARTGCSFRGDASAKS
jgi:hypothetical protein